VHVRSFSKLERDVFNPGRMTCLPVKELEAGLLFHSCLLSAIFGKSHPVHVFHFLSSLRSVSCCFGAVNYGKSHKKKKKLKNLLFKRCHTTCLSTASNAPRRMPQFLFSLQVLHIHMMERIVCLVKDIWCCPCIY